MAYEGIYHLCKKVASSWEKQIVDSLAPNEFIWDFDFKLDKFERPHISYGIRKRTFLPLCSIAVKYARWENNRWYHEFVDRDTFGEQGLEHALAVDSNCYPHFVIKGQFHNVDDTIEYAFKDETGWHRHFFIDPGRSDPDHFRMELDFMGRAHIVYRAAYPRSLLYLIWSGEFKLDTIPIELPAGSPTGIDLILDRKGFPHIAYGDNFLWYIRGYEGQAIKEKRKAVAIFFNPSTFKQELRKGVSVYR